jgi:hypothetical protein
MPIFIYIKQMLNVANKKSQTPWPEPASELYRQSESSFSAKLVPTFAGRGCHVVSVKNPYGHILRFLDRNRCYFFQLATQLYSRGWVDPVPDTLLLSKCGNAGNRTRTPESVAKNSDHSCTAWVRFQDSSKTFSVLYKVKNWSPIYSIV